MEVHKSRSDLEARKKILKIREKAWVVVVEEAVGRHMIHLDQERDLMEVVHRNQTVVVHVMQLVVGHKS